MDARAVQHHGYVDAGRTVVAEWCTHSRCRVPSPVPERAVRAEQVAWQERGGTGDTPDARWCTVMEQQHAARWRQREAWVVGPLVLRPALQQGTWAWANAIHDEPPRQSLSL